MPGCILITLLKGVVYKENSGGPRIEPCGTSNSRSCNSERVDPSLIQYYKHLMRMCSMSLVSTYISVTVLHASVLFPINVNTKIISYQSKVMI